MVIERTVYDDFRVGEHLQPAVVLQLRALDRGSKMSLDSHLVSAGVEAYWGSATANHMDYFLHPGQHGLNLSRPRFDADLARACERSGATVLRSASLTRRANQHGMGSRSQPQWYGSHLPGLSYRRCYGTSRFILAQPGREGSCA